MMETTYALDEADYLAYQLFTVSKSPRIKNKRIKEWVWTTVAFLSLTVILHLNNNAFLGNYFLIATVLSILFFPLYTKWRYKKHYIRHIRDVYKNNFGQQSGIKFTNENIETTDKSGESKIKLTQVNEINETADHYFLQLLTGHALIIPKEKATNTTEIANTIKDIATRQNIKHNVELDWKWK